MPEADLPQLKEVAARFCQAVAELQSMGWIKQDRRRAGTVVQWVAFQPDAF